MKKISNKEDSKIYNALDKIQIVFTDMDGSFLQPEGKILNGAEETFQYIKNNNNGRIILISNRSPEACYGDNRIYTKFKKNGSFQNNKIDDDYVITASGALILSRDLKELKTGSKFLTPEQKDIISKSLIEYLPYLKLIEWIERGIIKNPSKFSRINKINKRILNKIRNNEIVSWIISERIEDKVRKFHINRNNQDEKEISKRARRNSKRELEHIIRKQIKFTEYVRHIPNGILRKEKVFVNPKYIVNKILNRQKDISKIVIGFRHNNEDDLLSHQLEFGNKLIKAGINLVVMPDLTNLHIMNSVDKESSIKYLSSKLNIPLSESLVIGNSGIDLTMGIEVAKSGGLFIYVGKNNEHLNDIKNRFFKELTHPLLAKEKDYNIEDVEKLIDSKNILFHNPSVNLYQILKPS